VLQELLELVSPANHDAWLAQVSEMDRKHPFRYRDDHVLRPQYVLQELHRLTKGDAVMATGVGQHQMWAMQWYPSNHPRHFISSGGLGTMGYGFPAALGAKFARPEQTVVCIDGDGSFQMTCVELTTSAIAARPVLVVILNNRFLGMVRQWQELFFGRRYASSYLGGKTDAAARALRDPARDRYLPDFVKLAEAHGALGLRVERKEDVTTTLERALEEVKERTVVVDVLIDPNEKVFPMVPAGAALDDIIIDMA
jgi:acetolactate synthase-1/2/3 large subunit